MLYLCKDTTNKHKCDQACKNTQWGKKLPILLSSLYHNLITIYTNEEKVSADVEINGLSTAN